MWAGLRLVSSTLPLHRRLFCSEQGQPRIAYTGLLAVSHLHALFGLQIETLEVGSHSVAVHHHWVLGCKLWAKLQAMASHDGPPLWARGFTSWGMCIWDMCFIAFGFCGRIGSSHARHQSVLGVSAWALPGGLERNVHSKGASMELKGFV